MQIRTLRDLQVTLPGLDAGRLDPVGAPWTGHLDGALVKTGDAPGHTLTDRWLRGSYLAGLDLSGADWEDVTAIGCVFERVDFSGAQLTGLRLERCHFVGCRLSRSQLTESALDHVLFEDCRLDKVTWDDVESTGPVGFVASVLLDTVLRDCRLGRAALEGCRLRQVTLEGCDLRGADLRGNRLSGVTGLASLRGVTLEPAQLTEFTELAMRDLELVVRGPMT